MTGEREFEAGTEPDEETAAFLAREESGSAAPPEPKTKNVRAKDEPDFDAEAAEAGGEDADEDDGDTVTPEAKAAAEAVEQRARLMGWVPPEEFRGDGGRKPLSAQEFIDRANPAILHERLEKLAGDRERDRQEHENTVARLERMNAKALEKQAKEHEANIAALKRRRNAEVAQIAKTEGEEAAAEHGDKWDAYIDNQKPPETDEVKAPAAASTGPDPSKVQEAANTAAAWVSKRPQFKTDPVFEAAARKIMSELATEMPNEFEKQFAELDRRLAATGRFSDVYAKPNGAGVRTNGNGAPPADGRAMDGVRIAAKKSTNYASRMNAVERRQGERFVKAKLYPDLESYAKELHAND